MQRSMSWKRSLVSLFLVLVMLMALLPVPAAKAEGVTPAGDYTMAITDEQLAANEYETYYWVDNYNYTYNGQPVTFKDDATIVAGGVEKPLKNKQTTISIEQDGGDFSISLSGLTTPVNQISGAWNSGFGGKIEAVYTTDIPEISELRSGKLTSPLTLNDVPDGTYTLTGGSIFEKANEWSPGYDFDGDGTKEMEYFFGTLPDIVITVGGAAPVDPVYLGDATEAKVYDDFENDLWLQQQQKSLALNESVDLYPWRTPQIVTDTINNDVARPNFHFEVIEGKDVIALDTEASTEKAVVTGKKAGTAVVKVTYDALDYKDKTFGAISPVNTGYIIYTVGETGTATITSSLDNWRHYDTIYYNEGKTAPYEFTVETSGAESLSVTVNGLVITGEDGKYTANLENRSNIIGLVATDADGNTTSIYRVVDARFVEVVTTNKSRPDKLIEAGDTANISLKGITMPVYKLATIYNPQFGKNATRIIYNNEGLGKFEGKCSQWDLATNNDFDVTFTEAGEYTFTSEAGRGISCFWWGDTLGADQVKQGVGEPNLNADDVSGYFSTLPSFNVKVAAASVIKATDISVEPQAITLKKGEIGQLNATLTPADTTETVSWSSSDEAIATVDEKGEVKGLTQGEATITAQVGELTATCNVTVSADEFTIPVTSIKVNPKTTGLFTDEGEPFGGTSVRYILTPSEATDNNITWSTSDESMATVVPNPEYQNTGIVTVHKPGTFQIIATASNGVSGSNEWTFRKPNNVTSMEGTLSKLPALDQLTLADETAVTSARSAYDKLPEKVKPWVENYDVLADAEGKLAELQGLANKVALNQKIGEAQGYSARPYTTASYQALQGAIATAQGVAAQVDATQVAVDAQVVALDNAIAGLQEKPLAGQITFSFERFTLGQGFIEDPVQYPIYAEETAADVLERYLEDHGYGYTATKPPKNFYLSSVDNTDTGVLVVPAFVTDLSEGEVTTASVKAQGKTSAGNTLAEFDYSQGSGWFYFVNNADPEVGFDECPITDGDVMRVQFTLWYGKDVKGSDEEVVHSNKDAALKALAALAARDDKDELLANAEVKAAYDTLYSLIQNAAVAQPEVDAAASQLADTIAGLDAAAELAAYRQEMQALLVSYKNPADYRVAQQTELAQAVAAGKAAIDAAADKAGVDGALASAKAAMDAIKTDAQLAAEEAKLADLAAKVENLPESPASELTNDDKKIILDALGSYNDLDEGLKETLNDETKAKLESAQSELRAANHSALDGKVTALDDGSLPDNVALTAEELALSALDVSARGELIIAAGIKLIDLRTGDEYVPGQKVTIVLDAGRDLTAVADRVLVAHQKDDGTVEYLVPTKVEGSLVTFETESFSTFGIVLAADTTNGQAADNQATIQNGTPAGSPSTGDETNLPLYFLFLALSGTALVVLKRRAKA